LAERRACRNLGSVGVKINIKKTGGVQGTLRETGKSLREEKQKEKI